MKKSPVVPGYNSEISVPHPGPSLTVSSAVGQRNRPEVYQPSNTNDQQQISDLDWVRQALCPWSQNLPQPTPPVPSISPDLPGELLWANQSSKPPGSHSVSTDQMARSIHSLPQHQWSECADRGTHTASSVGFSVKPQCHINQSGYSSVPMDQVVPSHATQSCWQGSMHRQGQAVMHYPQTSLGDISDLIYSAAVVTNLADFWLQLLSLFYELKIIHLTFSAQSYRVYIVFIMIGNMDHSLSSVLASITSIPTFFNLLKLNEQYFRNSIHYTQLLKIANEYLLLSHHLHVITL